MTSTATLLATTTHSTTATKFNSCPITTHYCQSQWLHGLRCGSVVACLLGLQVWILPRAWMAVPCVVHCQVEVSVTGRSLIQRSPIGYGVSECNLKTLTMMRPRLTRVVESFARKQHTNKPPTWKSTRISIKVGCTILTQYWKHNYMIWLNKQIKSFIRLADTDQEVPTSPDHPGCNTPGLIWADAQRWMANKNRTFKWYWLRTSHCVIL